ncbi:MAG TPA: nitroreductase [Acidimicrobiia bacterium]|nr:nitroreductase [Acidimicrobiia bacterium]
MNVLDAIRARRSIGRLVEPAPSPDELRLMLEAAACAPDHGELRPWKFVVLGGQAKDDFGQVLLDAYLARCEEAGVEPTEGQRTKERTKLGRAPMVIVAAAVRRESDKIPWEEQQASAAAAVQNLCLAAVELGYATMWRTGDPAYDARVKVALGLREADAVMGFVYVGTPSEGGEKPPKEPSLDGVVEHWRP